MLWFYSWTMSAWTSRRCSSCIWCAPSLLASWPSSASCRASIHCRTFPGWNISAVLSVKTSSCLHVATATWWRADPPSSCPTTTSSTWGTSRTTWWTSGTCSCWPTRIPSKAFWSTLTAIGSAARPEVRPTEWWCTLPSWATVTKSGLTWPDLTLGSRAARQSRAVCGLLRKLVRGGEEGSGLQRAKSLLHRRALPAPRSWSRVVLVRLMDIT